MALITRISRLFRADFNAVLDRIEEPDVLLKQALREMEEDVYIDDNNLKIFKNENSQIKIKLKELQGNIEEINDELDLCFKSNESELARSQVKRKLEVQRYEKHLKNKLSSVEKKENDLISRIHENKTRLTVMQQKLELLINEESQISEYEFFPNISNGINEDDVEIAFLREKQARSTL